MRLDVADISLGQFRLHPNRIYSAWKQPCSVTQQDLGASRPQASSTLNFFLETIMCLLAITIDYDYPIWQTNRYPSIDNGMSAAQLSRLSTGSEVSSASPLKIMYSLKQSSQQKLWVLSRSHLRRRYPQL